MIQQNRQTLDTVLFTYCQVPELDLQSAARLDVEQGPKELHKISVFLSQQPEHLTLFQTSAESWMWRSGRSRK